MKNILMSKEIIAKKFSFSTYFRFLSSAGTHHTLPLCVLFRISVINMIIKKAFDKLIDKRHKRFL